MMQVIQKDKVQMLVLNKDDEIIITTSKGKGYISIYVNNDTIVIDNTINNEDYMIPFKDRAEFNKQKALKEKEQKHQAYLNWKNNLK